jgi:predicted metal-dependent peptidase
MPGTFQRIVDQILEPQVSWKDKIRLTVLGHVGNRRDNWAVPNRRRIVMDPIVYLPGKRGSGADLVAVWIDCSGSVGDREYNAFFSEVGGLMQDVKPKRLLVGWCDAIVQRTEWVSTLDEVYGIMREPVPGRGGTSFRPPFQWMADEGIVPDTCVYLTDGIGPFPTKTAFPTIWVMSTDMKAPFGETVQIKT